MNYDLHQLAKEGKLNQVLEGVLTLKTITAVDNCGATPLHYAIWFGHLDQVPVGLLTPKMMMLKDNWGHTLCHVAALQSSLNQIPEGLLTLETMLEKDVYGDTPLHLAVRHNCLDQVLGIDFGGSAAAKEIVGEEWWVKNLDGMEALRQKQKLKLRDEETEVDLF